MSSQANKPPLYWDGTGQHALYHPQFPRSNRYHPEWVFRNQMGPNVLWLAELLADSLDLQPGMRVLDMGCGRGLSSIFLAREFGVQVWANDLWVSPTENHERFQEAGVSEQVFPIHAEAHVLPYAEDFFDAIFSVDAYHYFGTDQMYLGYFVRFLKVGGQLGVLVPGLHQPWPRTIPAYLTEPQGHGETFWAWDMATFKTAAWWDELWSQYPFLRLDKAAAVADGGHIWAEWERRFRAYPGDKLFPDDLDAIAADQNRYLTFIQLIGRRSDSTF